MPAMSSTLVPVVALLAAAGCTAHPHGVQTSPAVVRARTGAFLTRSPDGVIAARVCRSHFAATTVSVLTTLGEAFRSGTEVPREVHGDPSDAPAAQCLVPRGDGIYGVMVIVLRDGKAFPSGSQTVGDRIIPRP